MFSGLNYTKFRCTQGVHMGMAWEAIIHTLHPNPNAVTSWPYWLHHSEKACSLGWKGIVPWYPSKLCWFFFIFFCNKNRRNMGQYLSLSLSLSHVFLQRSSGNQMIQMHVNKRVHLMSSVNFLLISCITLRTGTGVALTSWSCKAVDSHVGFHWIWGKHLTRLWMSLPWGHCGATDLLSGVAGTGGTRIYGWTNICPYQVQ